MMPNAQISKESIIKRSRLQEYDTVMLDKVQEIAADPTNNILHWIQKHVQDSVSPEERVE